MSMTRTSTGTDPQIATLLAEVGSDNGGSLVFLQVQKKGETRRGNIYGDDLVEVLIWTGFDYKALIERSQKKLDLMLKGPLITDLTKASPHLDSNVAASCAAIQDTQAWFYKVLSAKNPSADGEVSESAWEPLMVNGQKVRGCRVHRATGEVHIQGVKLGEKVVKAAPNGEWTPKSSAKTVAKNLLRDMLPIGLYVQYSLSPERLTNFKVGSEASRTAKNLGVPVEPEAIRALFKVAA